jgi:ABC-type antimicrobial peptide transport system permease subunit
VLAFSVSGRTREFGIRLAIGSQPHHLLTTVLGEGAWMGLLGVAAGGIGGYILVLAAAKYFVDMQMPGVVPVTASAILLMTAAVIASVLPASRAARVDVIQALRSE